MSEGDAGTERSPEVPGPEQARPARRAAVDIVTVLLAVERVAADVAALGRAVAAQPEAVAARIDVDGATASLGVQVGALGSAVDQVRLALMAALDRMADRLDAPVWLPELHAALAQPPPPPGEQLDLRHDIAELAAEVQRGLAELSVGLGAGATVTEALDRLGPRLEAVEDATRRMAEEATPVTADGTTAPVEGGARADPLADRVEQVAAGLDEALGLLRARGGPEQAGNEDDDRFDALVDVLAGVTRRQDQITAAVASVLDQVRGPTGIDAVLDRMEQRERSVAARLDRIDAELRRHGPTGQGPSAEGASPAGGEATEAVEALVARLDEQDRALGLRLDQIAAELQRVAAATAPAEAPGRGGAEVDQRLDAVLRRLEDQERAMASHLRVVGDRMTELAARVGASQAASEAQVVVAGAGAKRPEALAALIQTTAERLDRRLSRLEAALQEVAEAPAASVSTASAEQAALRLADLRAERARVQARLREERLRAGEEREWRDGP